MKPHLVIGVAFLCLCCIPPAAQASSHGGDLLDGSAAVAQTNETANTENGTQPVLDVGLDGDTVGNGETFVVDRTDVPSLRIDASHPANDSSLATVLVTIDGRTTLERSDLDGPLTVNRTATLTSGNNSVRIVAKSDDGQVTTTQFWVYRETVPPALSLTEPTETRLGAYRYDDLNVSGRDIRFAGSFTDKSGVASATISQLDEQGRTAIQTIGIRGGQPSFDERLLLMPGQNRVRVSVEDIQGNVNVDTFSIDVVDVDEPSATFEYDGRAGEQPQYTVNGTITDSVGVKNASITVIHVNHGNFQESNHTYEILPDKRTAERTRDRLRVPFSERVRLLEGRNIVTLSAYDYAGHKLVRSFDVSYEQNTEQQPDIEPIWDRTQRHGATAATVPVLVTDGDGDLSEILVKVSDVENGTVTDVETVSVNDTAAHVFEKRLEIPSGRLRLTIQAVDARGVQTRHAFDVDAAALQDGAASSSQRGSPSQFEVETPTTQQPSTPQQPQTAQPTQSTDTPEQTTTEADEETATTPQQRTTTAGTGTAGESDRGSTDSTNSEPEDGATVLPLGGLGGFLVSLPGLVAVLTVVVGGGYLSYRRYMRV